MNKIYSTILIFVSTIIIGTMNTLLLKPEDVGSWKNYLGYAFLIIALLNILFLVKQLKNRDNER
ncbi:MAG: hypothetical protein GY931_15550 [Maribacter sp.]|nr:hypothetical protein [Maribacter sp.]